MVLENFPGPLNCFQFILQLFLVDWNMCRSFPGFPGQVESLQRLQINIYFALPVVTTKHVFLLLPMNKVAVDKDTSAARLLPVDLNEPRCSVRRHNKKDKN